MNEAFLNGQRKELKRSLSAQLWYCNPTLEAVCIGILHLGFFLDFSRIPPLLKYRIFARRKLIQRLSIVKWRKAANFRKENESMNW